MLPTAVRCGLCDECAHVGVVLACDAAPVAAAPEGGASGAAANAQSLHSAGLVVVQRQVSEACAHGCESVSADRVDACAPGQSRSIRQSADIGAVIGRGLLERLGALAPRAGAGATGQTHRSSRLSTRICPKDFGAARSGSAAPEPRAERYTRAAARCRCGPLSRCRPSLLTRPTEHAACAAPAAPRKYQSDQVSRIA